MNCLSELIGECRRVVEVRDQLRRLTDRFGTSAQFPPILLRGETGTGKGLAAHTIHNSSGRSHGLFVDIDCAAIPETLIESELFGYERGAFTDARQTRIGLFEAAHGGTLFIDEIGLLPRALQGKLLKVVEERSVRKLGGTRSTHVDVVIIAATNEDLSVATQEGRFREDLYHRLAALTFILPPLRERGQDIVLLADHFLSAACGKHGIPAKHLTREAYVALLAYRWPGNVRELANVMERVALLSDDSAITPVQLELSATSCNTHLPNPKVGRMRLRDSMSSFERTHLREALQEAAGNVSLAAERLGLPRNTLRYRIARLGLSYTAAHRHRSRILEDPVSTGAEASSLEWERRLLELTHTQIAAPPGRQFWLRHGPSLDVLQQARLFVGMVALGGGCYVYNAKGNWTADPIRVGIATDLTGPMGWGGIPNSNVAKMLIDEINDNGGLIGRPVQMILEDTASNEQLAVGKVHKLVTEHKVDVVFGGITSSMRNAIKDVIVNKALYVYPQLYEGGECTPYLFCSGPTPAQQCDTFIPWLIKDGGKRFYLPSADYVWPRVLNKYARKVIEESGGEVVGEEYFPVNQNEYSASIKRIMSNRVDVVFNTVIPPGVAAFFKQLYEAGFNRGGGRLACVYYDENALNITPECEIEGLASCLDYFRAVSDPYGTKLQEQYTALYGTKHPFTAGTAATGMYRGLCLWAAAVTEAKSVKREPVAAALDHAKIANGPGGGCEMVPGTRHVKMNMYTAVADRGRYRIVDRSNGPVLPGTA
jgi:branched-chain amino acid transport system substrate-binding protein